MIWVLPSYQAVALERAVVAGAWGLAGIGAVGYLLGLGLVGSLFAVGRLNRMVW